MIEKLFENYSYGHRDYLNGGMSFGYRFFLIDSLIDVQVEKKLGNEVVERLTWRKESLKILYPWMVYNSTKRVCGVLTATLLVPQAESREDLSLNKSTAMPEVEKSKRFETWCIFRYRSETNKFYYVSLFLFFFIIK